MKAAKLILIIIVTAVVVNFVRGGQDFSLPRVLPFCSGNPLSFWYDVVGGCGLLILLIYGLRRLKQPTDSPNRLNDVEHEEDNYEYELQDSPAQTGDYDIDEDNEE